MKTIHCAKVIYPDERSGPTYQGLYISEILREIEEDEGLDEGSLEDESDASFFFGERHNAFIEFFEVSA